MRAKKNIKQTNLYDSIKVNNIAQVEDDDGWRRTSILMKIHWLARTVKYLSDVSLISVAVVM